MLIVLILSIILGVLLMVVCLGLTVLLEPLIAIMIIYSIYKLIKHFVSD